MRWHCLISSLLALLLSGCFPMSSKRTSPAITDLELVQVWFLDSTGYLEPSGLTEFGGQLYTVADKVDNTVYRVEFDGESASLVPHLRFTPPERGPLDWEGITSDPEGNFHLVSETRSRILELLPNGEANWVTPNLRNFDLAEGLLAKRNAGLEGIVLLDPGHWLTAAEREPRGLIDVRLAGDDLSVSSSIHRDSPFLEALPLLRIPDFTGLDTDGGRVFALSRNSHLVVQIDKSSGDWREIRAWSYKHIETDPAWAYEAQTYGQAEGLVVMGLDVFIIFDNNLGGRQADPSDRRPLLVHARFPGEN